MTVEYEIDTSNPVLVTGATGYVAGVLIKHLLEEGVTVHGTVRDPSNEKKFQHLLDIADKTDGSVKFFKGDLEEDGSFKEAMAGCTIVFHTASPFQMNVVDPYKDLVKPAVTGTKNVLRQATKTPTVKKVVVTSSCAAIFGDNADIYDAPNQTFTEDVWNTSSSLSRNPYSYSKTLAEKAAWIEAGSQTQWKLVTINPGIVFGPGTKYHESSESYKFFKSIVDGTMEKGAPKIGFCVDVRDVAKAHIAAAYLENTSGRHLLCVNNSTFYECGVLLSSDESKFANKGYGFPTTHVPWYALWLIGPWLTPPMERSLVYRNADIETNFDHTKAEKELGIEFTPLLKTLEDMLDQFIEHGIIEKK